MRQKKYPLQKNRCPLMITNNYSIYIYSKNGNTPLHNAIGQGNSDNVRLLLLHGADPNIQNCVSIINYLMLIHAINEGNYLLYAKLVIVIAIKSAVLIGTSNIMSCKE